MRELLLHGGWDPLACLDLEDQPSLHRVPLATSWVLLSPDLQPHVHVLARQGL